MTLLSHVINLNPPTEKPAAAFSQTNSLIISDGVLWVDPKPSTFNPKAPYRFLAH